MCFMPQGAGKVLHCAILIKALPLVEGSSAQSDMEIGTVIFGASTPKSAIFQELATDLLVKEWAL